MSMPCIHGGDIWQIGLHWAPWSSAREKVTWWQSALGKCSCKNMLVNEEVRELQPQPSAELVGSKGKHI